MGNTRNKERGGAQSKTRLEMDKEITAMMIHISGDQHYTRPFSTDPVTALELWQFAADAFGSVALIKMTEGPKILGDYCGIKDDEDEESHVEVMTENWMESLAKAALLYHYGLFGNYADPELDHMAKVAPVRDTH